MALEISEVRPAVLSPATVAALRVLLAFRHFFRHAYAVELEGVRLAELQRIAVDVSPAVRTEIDALDEFLRALADDAT